MLDDALAVARAAAERLQAAARARPELVLALPTGHTPLPLYAELHARRLAGALDLSRARAFNLDELALPAGDPRAFEAYMLAHAWPLLGLRRERCHLPQAGGAELDANCAAYEASLRAAGGLDLALLGLGADGHVAYNLPGPPLLDTHVVTLPDALARAHGLAPDELPLRALTMGLGTLWGARALLLLATGASKAAAVAALAGDATDVQRWPCAFLRAHPDFELLVDRGAAQGLPAAGPRPRGPRTPWL